MYIKRINLKEVSQINVFSPTKAINCNMLGLDSVFHHKEVISPPLIVGYCTQVDADNQTTSPLNQPNLQQATKQPSVASI